MRAVWTVVELLVTELVLLCTSLSSSVGSGLCSVVIIPNCVKILCWHVQQWRRRFFVLYAPPPTATISSECHANLHYFEDERLVKKKGSIDLRHCEEVLADMAAPHYHNVFCLRTKHHSRNRTYYLSADTEAEMNKWVETLCRVLHLDNKCELHALFFFNWNIKDIDIFRRTLLRSVWLLPSQFRQSSVCNVSGTYLEGCIFSALFFAPYCSIAISLILWLVLELIVIITVLTSWHQKSMEA